MNELWFVSLDTRRLARVLRGRQAELVSHACAAAAAALGLRLVDAAVVPSGVRALVRGPRCAIRAFVRRFVAQSARAACTAGLWRDAFRVARIAPNSSDRALRFFADCRAVAFEDARVKSNAAESHKPKRPKSSIKTLAVILRTIESRIDADLGSDEAAARVRRYVADHDAPRDDVAAFARLCFVIFAQGMGFGPVDRVREQLVAAFDGFDPQLVSQYDDARVSVLMEQPIIRNEVKIRACIENARRWLEAAREQGTYLARVAAAAAQDDATGGWPALVAMLRADFVRFADTAACQTLKRWGFFTAFANPTGARVFERLGFIAAGAPSEAQRLLVRLSHELGRDPYSLEAAFALFAGIGPCAPKPRCHECPLLERCPTGSAQMTG